MKREGMRHPKMLDLMARLSINRREAVGLVDLLLDWVMDYAPCGDIGKWNNGVIGNAVEWQGSADELVEALVGSGWLDESELHRLIVHDWPVHAPTFVRAKLKKLGLEFLECYKSTGNIPEASIEGDGDGNTPLLPSPQSPSNQSPAAAAPKRQAAAAEPISKSEWDEARPIAQKIAKTLRPDGKPLSQSERDWAAKIAVLTRRRGEAWLNVAMEGLKGGKAKEPKALMHHILDDECQRDGGSRLNRELSRIVIPEEFILPKVLA